MANRFSGGHRCLSGVDPDPLVDSANDAPDEWGRIPAAVSPATDTNSFH